MEANEHKRSVEEEANENMAENQEVKPLFDEEGNLLEKPVEMGSPPTEVTPEEAEEKTEVEAETEEKVEAEEKTETPVAEEAEVKVEVEKKTDAPVAEEAEVKVEVEEKIEAEEKTDAPVAEEAEVKVEVEVEEKTDAPVAEEVEVKVEVEAEAEEKIEVEVEKKTDAPVAEEAEVEVEKKTDAPAPEEVEEKVEVEERAEVKAEAEENIEAKEKTEIKAEEKVEDSSADKGDDEESDDDDEEEEEDQTDYTSYSKEELVKCMEELVSDQEAALQRQKAGKVRLAFMELIKGERAEALEAFIAEGGKETDYKHEQDSLDERFFNAIEVYKKKKQALLDQQEEIKKENLARKLEMLEQIKELINSEEPLKKTYDEFRSIQDKWREIGNVPKNEISNLWQSYHFLVEKFFDKVKINNELRDLDMKKNLEMKIALCERAEELLLETSVLKSFKQLQEYHRQWKEIGAVPIDKKDELWERFRATTEKINERRREYYEKLHQDHENNYSAKRALCEKVEELMAALPDTFKGWQGAQDEVNELMKMWRSLGPAPRQHNDEIWKRFKGQVDEFFKQKKSYFNAVKDEQVNNYNLKLDICQQAELLQESTDWRETTEELIRLQQEWKKIGPVPRRHSDKIWKRFRSACDTFFNRKQSHFSAQKASEEDNLQRKEDLIKQIQELEVVDNNREGALEKLKEIQRQFIETGHVPFKKKNDVNASFREAINQKLDQLKINYSEISTGMPRGRREGRRDGSDNRPPRGGDRGGNPLQNKIQKMKSDIALWENNLGFLANSAAAEVLKSEFEKKIQSTKDEIALLEAQLKQSQESS